jgi:hypothetical protein
MAPQLAHDLAVRFGGSEYGDTKQTAKRLNVSPSFLNKARITGDGPPFVKFGAAVRYHLPTAMAWAASLTQRSTSESLEVA